MFFAAKEHPSRTLPRKGGGEKKYSFSCQQYVPEIKKRRGKPSLWIC